MALPAEKGKEDEKMKKISVSADGVKTAKERTVQLMEKVVPTVRGARRQLLVPSAIFAASFFFGSTPCTDGIYPFGGAILCAAAGSVNTVAAFTGAMLSTLFIGENTFIYIIAHILLLMSRVVANGIKGTLLRDGRAMENSFNENGAFRLAASVAQAVFIGALGFMGGESLYFSIYKILSSALIYSVITLGLMQIGSREGVSEQRALAGVCTASFGLILTLSGVALPFSIATATAFFLTVWTAYSVGVGGGAAVGMACGMALGAVPAGALALTGALSGLLFMYGRGIAVVASALCGALLVTVSGGAGAAFEYVPETVFASAVLIPLIKLGALPKGIIRELLGVRPKRNAVGLWERKSRSAAMRWEKIGNAMDSLSRMLVSAGERLQCPTEQEAYRICTAARAQYCGGCTFEDVCAGGEGREVDSFFSNLSHSLALRGRVSASIVPKNLAVRCYNMDYILDSVNTSAKRLAGMSAVGTKTELLSADYAAVAQLLRETAAVEDDWSADRAVAEELRRELLSAGFDFSSASVYGKRKRKIFLHGVNCARATVGEEDIRRTVQRVLGTKVSPVEFSIEGKSLSAHMCTLPSYSVKCGKYTGVGSRDTSSGDTIVSFENGEGMFYSLVSDGMGSGREAAETSGLSAVFIEKLLSAGCPVKSALELLNCFVRGNEGECFTTVDLMEADLITGRARFIKSGAAPSFVLRGGRLFRLHSKTVPVGIMRALDAEAVSFDLCDDDTVIMMSDGVTGNYEDCPWLYRLLSEGLSREDSPSRMAKLIGEAALENTGREDDVTVCVMKICKNII